VNDPLKPLDKMGYSERESWNTHATGAFSSHRPIAFAGAMPRFFVHVRSNGNCWSYDECGLDFPDVETARSQTLRAAHDLIDVFAARGEDPRDHAVEIENEAGEVVWHLPFSEIFLRDP
jgi:hypothetical protein